VPLTLNSVSRKGGKDNLGLNIFRRGEVSLYAGKYAVQWQNKAQETQK